MDKNYILGIPEIDAQHEEISRLVASLQEVINDKAQARLADVALQRLYQILKNHFHYEEALMAMVNYAELAQHKKMHRGVLQLFESYFAQKQPGNDGEHLGKLITDKVLGHVMEHDSVMTEAIKQHLSQRNQPQEAKRRT